MITAIENGKLQEPQKSDESNLRTSLCELDNHLHRKHALSPQVEELPAEGSS